MTGAELGAAAAAKAAGKAVNKAAKDDVDEKKVVLERAKDSPALDAAGDALARRMAVRQEIRLKLIRPFARLLGVSRTYFEGQFEADLNEHLKNVPDENLREPSGQIMGAAMQGLAFTQEEQQLKEMYLRLLAAASDDRRPHDAHPAFAQIIRELSSEEAELLKWCLAARQLPIARSKLNLEANRWNVLSHNLLDWPDNTEVEASQLASRAVWIDNWERLRLVDISYNEFLLPPHPPQPDSPVVDPYDWVDGSPGYHHLEVVVDEIGNVPGYPHISFDRGILRTTDFGARFLAAVS